MYFISFYCLMKWMDGWMDGWMERNGKIGILGEEISRNGRLLLDVFDEKELVVMNKSDICEGAVTWVNQNKAVYTAISVACGWAGAVLSLCKPRNSEIRNRKLDDTDRPTNRRTDRRT